MRHAGRYTVCWVRGRLLSSLLLGMAAIAGVAADTIAASADEPPLLPVGADAYRMWDRWPYQRIGERAYMRSTYDRSGGNEHARRLPLPLSTGRRLQRHARCRGAGHALLRPLQPLARQSLALRGRWRGPPASRKPAPPTRYIPVRDSVVPAAVGVPRSADLDLGQTKGADLCGCRSGSTSSLRHGLLADLLRHRLLHLPPVREGATALAADCRLDWHAAGSGNRAQLLSRAGSDIAPPAEHARESRRRAGRIDLPAAGSVDDLPQLRTALRCCARSNSPCRASRRWTSRECGCGFTGTDAASPRSMRRSPCSSARARSITATISEYLVKAFPMVVRYDAQRVHLHCYFPMPFSAPHGSN